METILRRHVYWFAVTFFTVFVVASGAYLGLPTHYTVSADVRVAGPPSAPPGKPARIDTAALQTDLADALVSDDVLGAVVDRVGPARLSSAALSGSSSDPSSDLTRMQAIARVGRAVGLARRDPPGVFTLRFVTSNSRLGIDVVNGLVDRLASLRGAGPDDPATRPSLEAAERTAAQADAAATRASDLAALDASAQTLAQRTHATLQTQVAAAQADQAAAQAAATAAQLGKGDPRTADTAELRRLRAARAELVAKQADLGARYGPLHPQMVELGQQLRGLDTQIEAETRLSRMLSADLVQARTHLAALQASLTLSQQLLAAYQAHAGQVEPLSQAATAARTRYEALLRSAQGASRTGAGLTVRPLSAAHVTAARRPVPLLPAVLGSAVLAGLISALVVYARDRRDQGFRGADDVRRILGVPLTASVPKVANVLAVDAVSAATAADRTFRGETGLAEAFRSLCQGLGIASAAGSTRCVAVCSAVAGEGKTTSALCLARTAAEMGLRVVVIDCDGRGQALSRQTATADGPGLVQVLRDQAAPDQAVVADQPHGPWLMRHSSTDEIGDLSDTRRLRELIGELTSAYDLVVLDTAPVLALAEARVVAALAEGVLLVARWRTTPVGATRLALDLLNRTGARVAAFALTMVQPSAGAS